MKKNVRGITLIALIITLVVLLILAGIGIQAITGTGIFEKTKQAKEKYENAQKNENLEMQDEINLIDKYLGEKFKLTAEEVGFNPNTSDTIISYDENWKNVKNVKEALDYLYNR